MLFDEVKAFVALGVVSRIGDLETCEAEFLEPVEVVAGCVERDLVSNGSAEEFVDGSTWRSLPLRSQRAMSTPDIAVATIPASPWRCPARITRSFISSIAMQFWPSMSGAMTWSM